MAFPQRLLTEGEELVVELHPHWSFLGWPLAATVAAAVVVIGAVVSFPHAPIGVIYVLGAVLLVAALSLAVRFIRYRSTSLVLTTIRIIRRSGVLGRSGLEIRLERVNSLSYHQSLLGWVLRYGEVIVEIGGEAGVEVFDHVPRPQAFQSLITEQLAALHRRARLGDPTSGDGMATPPAGMATPPAGTSFVTRSAGGEPTVAERLVQLDELRRRGFLSEAEFEAKRAELIRQL